MNTDTTFCRGNKCAIREHCKRYLTGLHFADDGNTHIWWMDACDEDRSLYEEK